MKWRNRARSSNIDDRRGKGGGSKPSRQGSGSGGVRMPTGRGGGVGGTLTVLVILLVAMALGFDPTSLMRDDVPNPPTINSANTFPATRADKDDLADFVRVVAKENEDLWSRLFADNNLDYTPAIIVLYSGRTGSGCGQANASTGPFYCPSDHKVYIDLTFYEHLRARFGAPGDFAQAYVIAHEIGHHVQQLTGVLSAFNQARPQLNADEANQWSVRIELQADCYAGVWAAYAGQENLFDRGDIAEALNAANQIGDDTLQKRMQGFAVPKSFNHGTSEQRQRWFQIGLVQADPAACDTFGAVRL